MADEIIYQDENGNQVSPEDLGDYEIIGEQAQAPQEQSSWFDTIGHGIGRGMISAAKPFGDLTSWLGDTIGDEAMSIGGRAFSNTADDIIKEDYTDTGVDPFSAQAITGNAISGISNMALSGAGSFSKAAGMLGIGSGLNAYDVARDEGQDYTDATLRGVGTGAADTLINSLEVAPALRNSGIGKRVLQTTATNLISNPIQEAEHELLSRATGSEGRDINDIIGQTVQNTATGVVTGGAIAALPISRGPNREVSDRSVATKANIIDQLGAQMDALSVQEPTQLTQPQVSSENVTVELPGSQSDSQNFTMGQQTDPGFTFRDPALPPALVGSKLPSTEVKKNSPTIDLSGASKIIQDEELIHLAQDSFEKARDAYNKSLPVATQKSAVDVVKESGAKTFPDLVNKDLLKPSPEVEKLSQGFKLSIEADTNSLKSALPWPSDYNPANGFKNGGPGFTILHRLKGQSGGIRKSILGVPDPKESVDAIHEAFKSLPERDLFLEGKVGPLERSSLARNYRLAVAFPKTITDKAGPVGKEFFDTVLDGGRQAHSISYDLDKTVSDYRGLDKTEKNKVNEILAAERISANNRSKQGLPAVNLDDSTLMQMGLSEKGVAGYKAVRNTMDQALNHLRDGFLAKADSISDPQARGMYVSEVDNWIKSMRDNKYVPFSRPGAKWSVAINSNLPQEVQPGVVAPERSLQFYGHYNSKAEAVAAAKAAMTKYGADSQLEIRPIPVAKASEYQALPMDIMVSAQEFNPDTFTQQVKSGRKGFVQHLAHADLIDGYQTDLQHSIDAYIEGVGNFAAHNKTKVKLDSILGQLTGKDNGAFRAWAEDYRSNLNVSKSSALGNVLWFLNFNYLAGVPSSAVTNLTQTLTTTMPNILRYNKKGAPAIVARSARDSFGILHDNIRGTKTVDPELRAIYDEATRRGVVDADNLKQLLDTGNTGAAFKNKVDGALMFMFGTAEKANRLIALTTGYHTGKSLGKSGAELQKFAESFVDDTQFIQGRVNRPKIAQGELGKAAFMYKLFGGNYIRFLRNNMQPGGFSTVLASLGSMAMLGGAAAVPGVNYLLKAAEAKGYDPKKKLRDLVDDKTVSDGLLYGIPAALGVNISGAVGTGDLVPDFDLTNNGAMAKLFLGPAGDYGVKARKAYDLLDLKGGTSYNPRAAMEQMAPRFLRNPLKTQRWASEGKLLDPSGKTIVDRPPTTLEAAQLAAGFTPQVVADYYESMIGDNNLIQSKAGVKNLISKLADAKIAGDEELFRKLLKMGAENGQTVEPDDIIAQIQKKKDPALGRAMNAPKRLRPELMSRLND